MILKLFESTSKVAPLRPNDYSGLPSWMNYLFGSLFLILGIAIFFLYSKTKSNAEKYKNKQLIEYKKQNRIKESTIVKYEDTKMYLPIWEKTKQFAPIIGGLTLCIIGIAWIVGKSILL
ncbi:hypothetical protein [Mesomycoplasma lagogenitalium]|uniref:DUF3899 domain-containing protein n=1 Tax=Mesomycoplasma lagogenitalium TaxID=171286 RepID=A0ABY8LUF7_9BACT|nr:hypothetical protein [Mesomycoplasma lagogenitalium]WGI36880.1 hypothetical protein QEG99_01175 [Mesomycoplasma lagogenitalium]